MNNALYRIEYNDTIIYLICILIAYYTLLPLLKKIIILTKEDKIKRSERIESNA